MSLRRTSRACLALSVIGLGASFVASSTRAAGALADRARTLLAQIEADPAAKDLVEPATSRSAAALARAAADAQPAQAELYEAAALQWAEVARDLRRAREAELASDQLERELSALHTELVRSRASVEQAVARVGRARQGLAELEAAAAEQPGGRVAPHETAPSKTTTDKSTTDKSSSGKSSSGKSSSDKVTPNGPARDKSDTNPAPRGSAQ